MTRHNVNIRANQHGKDSEVEIDGHRLEGVRRAEVVVDEGDATLIRLEIYCTINQQDPQHWIHADQVIDFINNDDALEQAIRETIGAGGGVSVEAFRQSMLLKLKIDDLSRPPSM